MASTLANVGGSDATAGIVRLPFPFRLAWKLDQQIGTFRCHRRLAEPLTAIFDETARHHGQAEMECLRLHIWGGCFNHRTMRGGTAHSTHASGAAVDPDPERDQLPWGRDRAAFRAGLDLSRPKCPGQAAALSLRRRHPGH